MISIITKYFIDLTPLQKEQFEQLFELYSFWNDQINVISRKDIDLLFERHILHSLGIAKVIDFKPNTQILDVGTGGGFPGIPLAILFPESNFLLVDSIGKKLKVIEAVAATLGLKNVTTQHTRIEDITNKKFDGVVSRAVAPLKDLIQWSKPVIRKKNISNLFNGLICLKGGDLAQEISESNCRPRKIEIFDLFKEEFFRDKFILYVST